MYKISTVCDLVDKFYISKFCILYSVTIQNLLEIPNTKDELTPVWKILCILRTIIYKDQFFKRSLPHA